MAKSVDSSMGTSTVKASTGQERRVATKQTSQSRDYIVFSIFAVSHIVAALSSPIQDCDEVFNYWEPTHYLNHGYGLQTWEYSPVYAIRSWAYAGLHAAVIAPFTLVSGRIGGKTAEFYAMRIVLAAVCAICETRLYSVIAQTTSSRIAKMFLLVVTTSSGMFHASTAFLPSTFVMYTTMLGVAEFMDWRTTGHLSRGILWFGIGVTLGWPFVGAIVLPFVLVEAAHAVYEKRPILFVTEALSGAVQSLFTALAQAGIDSYFYGRWLCVPLNIVLYNIFAGASKGPDIYGTEPWHFYVRNLLLNFNIFFVLALAAQPLLLLSSLTSTRSTTAQPLLRSFNLTCAFGIWFAIFSFQPHKEERFMYPAYPLLAINAAYSIHILLQFQSHVSGRLGFRTSRLPDLPFLAVTGIFLIGVVLSFLRTAGLVTGYSAPLNVYQQLRTIAAPGDTVCLGKEWYRFPSSYFLPDGVQAKFIKSSFEGLLPGEFVQARVDGFGYPGASAVPMGMNDENKEDVSKYIHIADCTFLVDSHGPSTTPSKLEPNYIDDQQTWETVDCKRFLDAGATSAVGRIIWTPHIPSLPRALQRQWGKYCLLKRRVG